jgi:hypothetical protein
MVDPSGRLIVSHEETDSQERDKTMRRELDGSLMIEDGRLRGENPKIR